MPPRPTTIPGYVNGNGQKVIRATGHTSTTHGNQQIYELHCQACDAIYGSNGCDIHIRRCPLATCPSNRGRQPGEKGEPLPGESGNLFSV